MVLHYSKPSGVVLVSIRYAVSQGCLPPLCALLSNTSDNDIIQCIVEALKSLLESASGQPEREHYVAILDEANGRYASFFVTTP